MSLNLVSKNTLLVQKNKSRLKSKFDLNFGHKKRSSKLRETYYCDQIGCEKRFNKRETLILHKRLHSGSGLECGWNGCQYKAKTVYLLKSHQDNKHSGLGPTHLCEWEGCSKLFQTKAILDTHMNQHLGKYPCDWSGCQFYGGSAYNLKKHQQTHLGIGIKPMYPCDWEGCTKQFSQKDSLRQTYGSTQQ